MNISRCRDSESPVQTMDLFPGANDADGAKRKYTKSEQYKQRRKHDRFNGMTEEEVRSRTLPDHLAANLDVVIVSFTRHVSPVSPNLTRLSFDRSASTPACSPRTRATTTRDPAITSVSPPSLANNPVRKVTANANPNREMPVSGGPRPRADDGR